MKSQRKRIPVVFTLHSTCAHVDTFFYGDEIFWSWFWIPKDGECFFLYNVFIIVEFPVNKEGLIYWRKKNPSDVLPHALQENLDALSSVLLYSCFHSSHVCLKYGYCISACPSNANVSAFLFRSHAARQTLICLDISSVLAGITLY